MKGTELSYTQLIAPTPNIPCTPGWCLQYVRQAFGGMPVTQGAAVDDWLASATKHQDKNFPDGVCVPVFFTIEAIPAGHIAIRMSDGTVYSSSDNSPTPHHHPSLDDLMNYYAYYNLPLTYLGWTEDVEGVPVIQEDDMAGPTAEEIATAVWNHAFKRSDGSDNNTLWLIQSFEESLKGVVKQTVDSTVRGVLNGVGTLDAAHIDATVTAAVQDALKNLAVTLHA